MTKAITNGIIVTEYAELKGKALIFDDKILGIVDENSVNAEEIIDAEGHYICPGLIDLHIHGYVGEDTSDGKEEGIRKIAQALPQNGVTAFLPTTMTVSWEEIVTAFENVRTLRPESRLPGFDGSEILGCHAEGPFINPARKGAQAADGILPPDADMVLPHKDIIRIITVAPEMPGGMMFVRRVTQESSMVVSIGHTSATYEQALEAIAAGASYITHTFNAMTALNHRKPGTAGAALTANVTAELIADAFHVHPGLFSLLHVAKGEKLVLVTDCTRAGGLEDGEYTLGGQSIFVKGIECRLADGTIAGSVLKLNVAVRNLRDLTPLPMWQAVKAASLSAASAIGASETKGSLTPGKDADIAIFDKDCIAQKTFVRGHLKFTKGDTPHAAQSTR